MIQVKNLTKTYGNHTAVDDISFTLKPGEIYGFLGPNGAGKSTTMNIIAGCLAATSGEVTVNEHDIFDDPVAAKRAIGYLPEQPPLYPDMTPAEYLRFVGAAKGLRRAELTRQVKKVMNATGVTEMQDRLIAHLSKGYRQRVGIAQALLGDPEIVLLDEPTVGLDPQQIIEVRELIRSLGRTRTVVLSSHILPEISAVCSHVLILSHGKLVADDSMKRLSGYLSAAGCLTLRVRGSRVKAPKEKLEQIFASFAEFQRATVSAESDGALTCRITAERFPDELCERISAALGEAGFAVLQMTVSEAGLENVFLALTGGVPEQDAPDRAAAEQSARASSMEAGVPEPEPAVDVSRIPTEEAPASDDGAGKEDER